MDIIKKIFAFIIDTAQTFLLAASIFIVIYIFFFRPYQVSGRSMDPTFKDQEFVITNLISLQFSDLKRGDVIVFHSPTEKDKDYIKRVIGTPGDTVSIQNGDVYVNGQRLDQSKFLSDDVKTYGGSFLREGQVITVPSGEYFVMGDNRSASKDSREFGPIKQKEVIGVSMFVHWPFDRARWIENPYK